MSATRGSIGDVPKTSARLLSLLSLLQMRRDWPGAVLAERLDISPRTVRRDVDRLRELGYPIVASKGPDGGYRLAAGTELPPLLFDDEQAVALAVALGTAAVSGAGIEEAAARALETVRQVMPARLRHRIDAVHFATVDRPAAPRADATVLMALNAAARAREVLRFDYAPASAARTDDLEMAPPRRVEPHRVVARDGRWYLLAWDLDRDDWRIFRADRIVPRVPTGPRFTPREVPGGDVAAFVTGRFKGSDGAGDWPCRGEVILELPASTVLEFSREAVVDELGPHRCRVVLGSWSWPGLAAEIAGFDADFEIVGPAELTAAFADLARRFADAAAESRAPTRALSRNSSRPPNRISRRARRT